MEQVRTALGTATGIVRTMLLLGLNCGFYQGDVAELKPEHVQGDHLVKGRAKNEWRGQKGTPSWLLWEETKAALQFGLPENKQRAAWKVFASDLEIKQFKALRKTVSQLIEDHVGEAEAKLYRGEAKGGGHGKYYSTSYTPLQVAALDGALTKVHKLLFCR